MAEPRAALYVYTIMLLTEFPDLQWIKKQAEEGFANRKAWGGHTLPTQGWPTVMLRVKTKDICRDNIRGPLSLFTNLKGKSSVTCKGNRVAVDSSFFFVSNHDQHYTLEIDKHTSTETFNIHFGEYFADQVLAALTSSPQKLLEENTFTAPFNRVEFFNRMYYRDTCYNRALQALQQNESPLKTEEILSGLMANLLQQDTATRKKAQRLPALKSATRQELLKRLCIATDYIYSSYNKDITLGELAAVACLSKFHFLRLFKVAFGKTPYQFISEVKVQQAKVYLKDPSLEVNTIARLLAFDNTSSFSRMFYNQTGLYPSQYR
jgi:AraC family transcriptional regulator